MFGYVWIVYQSVWLFNYSFISCLQWHVIYSFFFLLIVHFYPSFFFFIVHCYPSLANIIAVILLHVVSFCVTIIISRWNCVCLLWVSVILCSVCFFFKLFWNVFYSVCLSLSTWSSRYCLAMISVVFMCLKFLVISHPVSVMHIV